MNYKRLFIDNGLIFLTIVTQNREPILTKYIDTILKTALNVKKLYKFKIIAYVILPDHIHCIIKPNNINDYPKIIKSFKYSFTKNVGLVNPTYKKIWQNRYWEHTIRDENDLNKHLDYIHYNPLKHNLTTSIMNYKYSSFNSYVKYEYYDKNWCNFSDINNITDLNFE